MKLRKGQPRYKIPPYSHILGVRIEGNILGVRIEGNQRHNQMTAFMLYQVRLEELGEVDQKMGMPTKFALANNIIEFAPPPDRPYIVKIRYVPPVVEY